MKPSLLITSLLCSALAIACGDDKGQDSITNPQPTQNPTNAEDGESETGVTPTTGSDPTTPGTMTQTTPSGPTSESESNTTPPATESDAESDSDDTVSFFVMTTGGDVAMCDPFAQDCPDGEKCAAYAEGGGSSWNAYKCVPVTGTGTAGDPCTTEGGGVSGFDDCALGFMCWNVNAENIGYCLEQCVGSEAQPTCSTGVPCTITGNPLFLCLPECDPLLQDCAGDDLCIPSGDSFVCVLDASGDGGAVGDPCEFANSCTKGNVCLNTEGASNQCDPNSSGCCMPFCEFPADPNPCPDVTQCVQWFDPMMGIPPGKENIGFCAVPE